MDQSENLFLPILYFKVSNDLKRQYALQAFSKYPGLIEIFRILTIIIIINKRRTSVTHSSLEPFPLDDSR